MIPKKGYPRTPDNFNKKDLHDKIDSLRDSYNYTQGCLQTIGNTMYQLLDRINKLECEIKGLK